jgi:hypothetical protein
MLQFAANFLRFYCKLQQTATAEDYVVKIMLQFATKLIVAIMLQFAASSCPKLQQK